MAVGPGHSVPATVANTREETSVFSLLSDITPGYQKGSGCFQLQITQLEPGQQGSGLSLAAGTAVSPLQVTGKAPPRPM